MPKYRVYAHETLVYSYEVRADDEAEAKKIALQLSNETQRNPDDTFFDIGEVQPLDDDAEVEN